MIAKSIVYDQIKARNSPLISFDVSLKLINKCKHASMAYKEDLRKIALEYREDTDNEKKEKN